MSLNVLISVCVCVHMWCQLKRDHMEDATWCVCSSSSVKKIKARHNIITESITVITQVFPIILKLDGYISLLIEKSRDEMMVSWKI